MPTRSSIIEEIDFLSSLISERVRTTAAVILAFCWAFIVEGASAEQGGFLSTKAVIPPILLAVATLFFDFLQYLSGLRLNVRKLKEMQAKKIEEIMYNPKEFLYVVRQSLFYLKIILLGCSLVWLLTVIVIQVIKKGI